MSTVVCIFTSTWCHHALILVPLMRLPYSLLLVLVCISLSRWGWATFNVYGLVKSFVYFSLGFFFFRSCLLFWGYKPVHYMYRRYSFQPGGSLNGVFMNRISYFECHLSVMAPRKASEGRKAREGEGGSCLHTRSCTEKPGTVRTEKVVVE